MSDKGLGKGLDALLPDEEPVEDEQLRRIPVDDIEPDPDQPRTHFDPDRLEELTQSIEQQGLVEPVVVRPMEDGYQLVAGERRWRASCQAGLDRIPALVRDLSGADALAISLIENIQRENLTPVEEARAYKRLKDQQDWSQQELADNVGRSRSAVANTLRLLQLPEEVLEGLNKGLITAGHARALMAADEEDEIRELYQRIREESLSVRETERRAEEDSTGSQDETNEEAPSPPEPAADFSQLEAELEDHVGAEVRIESRDRKEGHIKIHFSNPDEFERLREQLARVGEHDR